MNIDEIFRKYFPNLAEQFSLKSFQKRSIERVIGKNDVLSIMPTGGGKSLIYWISGLALEGITMVISPLTALIDEQTSKLRDEGYEVLTIHSGVSPDEQIRSLTQFYNAELNPQFIFASPERIATDGFFEYVVKSRAKDFALFTIDEAHCISQWGFDFRPFYKKIPAFLNSVFGGEKPPVLCLTATINPKDIFEICNDFGIRRENVLKDAYLLRNEIELKQLRFSDENQKEEKLWQLLEIHRGEKTIVYLYRKYNKRGTEDLAKKAADRGFKSTSFHGDLSAAERQDIIGSFKRGETDVIFATNAFGMGIDIPDIRIAIHYMIPESVEQYYQEIGRAARDGKASHAYILYTNKNVNVRKSHFIDKSFPTSDDFKRVHKKITNNALGLKTLQYFDDEEIQQCLPYFIEHGIITVKSKGVTNLDIFSNLGKGLLQDLSNMTKTKGTITILKKSSISPENFADLVYSAVAKRDVNLCKSFNKCLIIENHYPELTEEQLTSFSKSIAEKKSYKYDMLDYLKYILDNTESSKELQQEIGLYLGMDKHSLGRIYKTRKGDLVRSKSEVIIANTLFAENIQYEYEEKLFYTETEWIEPDFTIRLNGKEFYWEHLGMIGTENYDKRWLKKKDLYERLYGGKLKITYESAVLTDSVMDLITDLKQV